MNLHQAVEFIFANRTNKGWVYAQHVNGQIAPSSDAFVNEFLVLECGEFPGYVQVCHCEVVLALEQFGVIGTVSALVKKQNGIVELVR